MEPPKLNVERTTRNGSSTHAQLVMAIKLDGKQIKAPFYYEYLHTNEAVKEDKSYLVLFFVHCNEFGLIKGSLFAEMRKFTEPLNRYYTGHIGKIFFINDINK